MQTAHLRKVGGSVMLAIPPSILEILGLQIEALVGLSVDKNRLIISPQNLPKYTLEELISLCDETSKSSEKDDSWFNGAPMGKELI